MRLFVAIEIPEDVRTAIGELINKLRDTCRDARWVRIAGLHVTLKYIGESPFDKLEEIKSALKIIPQRDPIAMNFKGLGFFPNARRPRVFWAGVEAGAELAALAAALEAALLPSEIQQAERTFTPHLTLARFKESAAVHALQAAIEKIGPVNFGGTTAKEFHLYQSILKPGGAEYTRLATFPFSGSNFK